MLLVLSIACLMATIINLTFVYNNRKCIVGHKWTPWSEWLDYNRGSEKSFRRVRYCNKCFKEDSVMVGAHNCYHTRCSHKDTLLAVFEEGHNIKRLEKELGL